MKKIILAILRSSAIVLILTFNINCVLDGKDSNIELSTLRTLAISQAEERCNWIIIYYSPDCWTCKQGGVAYCPGF